MLPNLIRYSFFFFSVILSFRFPVYVLQFLSVCRSFSPYASHISVSFFSYRGRKIKNNFRDWHFRMCVFSTHGFEISFHWAFHFFTNFPIICRNKMPTICNKGFIADLIACSTCFGHHYVHHQELEYYTVVAPCGISCCGFQVAGLVWS